MDNQLCENFELQVFFKSFFSRRAVVRHQWVQIGMYMAAFDQQGILGVPTPINVNALGSLLRSGVLRIPRKRLMSTAATR